MFTSIFIAIALLVITYYIHKWNKSPKEMENIPRISGFPMAWALLQRKYHDEVEDIIKKSTKGHDIYLARVGSTVNLHIISPEHVRDLLMESEDVAPKLEWKPENVLYEYYGNLIHDFFGNGLPFSNGEIWRTHRRLANPAFNNALSPDIVGKTVFDLFTFLEKRLNKPIDAFETMQRTTIEVLGLLAFDHKFGCLESEETPHIINVYKYIIETVESIYRIVFPMINVLPTENNRKFAKYLEEFNGFIFDIIEGKRKEIKNDTNASNRKDLLSTMLKLSEEDGIHNNTKQLRDEMVTFFVAGHDTTSMALCTSLYYLAKYPELQEKAQKEVISVLGEESVIPTSEQLKEMKYLTAVIKESLRIHPPSPGTGFRKLSKPTKIGPYVIPENVLCTINIWLVHHHPKFWDNPKKYDPERFMNNEKRHPFAWMPFSAGPRNCIGQNFALMEQKVILSMLLQKYNWALPENSINKEKFLLETQFLIRPVDLRLTFTERSRD